MSHAKIKLRDSEDIHIKVDDGMVMINFGSGLLSVEVRIEIDEAKQLGVKLVELTK